MTRRIVSAPGQSAPVVINLPMKTTDLTAHQTARVSGGCYPVPDDTSEVFDSLEDIWEDWEDVFNPWPWPM